MLYTGAGGGRIGVRWIRRGLISCHNAFRLGILLSLRSRKSCCASQMSIGSSSPSGETVARTSSASSGGGKYGKARSTMPAVCIARQRDEVLRYVTDEGLRAKPHDGWQDTMPVLLSSRHPALAPSRANDLRSSTSCRHRQSRLTHGCLSTGPITTRGVVTRDLDSVQAHP